MQSAGFQVTAEATSADGASEDSTSIPTEAKVRRVAKYLRRGAAAEAASSSVDGTDDARPDEMEGTTTVAQPLVTADVQLHSFGEPLPNVWAMKATGEWEEFEAKRLEQQRQREEWKELERRKSAARLERLDRQSRDFWSAQNILACRRGCWERGLLVGGGLDTLQARIVNFDSATNKGEDTAAWAERWAEPERSAAKAKIRKAWSKSGLNVALKACHERHIWPGGHLPELRDRLFRYDTGEALSIEEQQEKETSSESDDEPDSEEEREKQNQREKRRKELAAWKAMTPEQQAAAKEAAKLAAKEAKQRQLQELRAKMHKLRSELPAVAHGANDPRVEGKMPFRWAGGGKAAGASAGCLDTTMMPSEHELRGWLPDAQRAFWEMRWKNWEAVKLAKCQVRNSHDAY